MNQLRAASTLKTFFSKASWTKLIDKQIKSKKDTSSWQKITSSTSSPRPTGKSEGSCLLVSWESSTSKKRLKTKKRDIVSDLSNNSNIVTLLSSKKKIFSNGRKSSEKCLFKVTSTKDTKPSKWSGKDLLRGFTWLRIMRLKKSSQSRRFLRITCRTRRKGS